MSTYELKKYYCRKNEVPTCSLCNLTSSHQFHQLISIPALEENEEIVLVCDLCKFNRLHSGVFKVIKYEEKKKCINEAQNKCKSTLNLDRRFIPINENNSISYICKKCLKYNETKCLTDYKKCANYNCEVDSEWLKNNNLQIHFKKLDYNFSDITKSKLNNEESEFCNNCHAYAKRKIKSEQEDEDLLRPESYCKSEAIKECTTCKRKIYKRICQLKTDDEQQINQCSVCFNYFRLLKIYNERKTNLNQIDPGSKCNFCDSNTLLIKIAENQFACLQCTNEKKNKIRGVIVDLDRNLNFNQMKDEFKIVFRDQLDLINFVYFIINNNNPISTENELKKSIIYVGSTFDLMGRLKSSHFRFDQEGCELKHQIIQEALDENNDTGEIIVFKYPNELICSQESLFLESHFIDYAFENPTDFKLFSNINSGKKVILIKEEDAKKRFCELLFNDLFNKFLQRMDDLNSFKFNYDEISKM